MLTSKYKLKTDNYGLILYFNFDTFYKIPENISFNNFMNFNCFILEI